MKLTKWKKEKRIIIMAANSEVIVILKKLSFNQKEADAFIKSLKIVKQSFNIEDNNNKDINIEEEFVKIIDEVYGNAIQKD